MKESQKCCIPSQSICCSGLSFYRDQERNSVSHRHPMKKINHNLFLLIFYKSVPYIINVIRTLTAPPHRSVVRLPAVRAELGLSSVVVLDICIIS